MGLRSLSRRDVIGGMLVGSAAIGARRAWAQSGAIRIGVLQATSGVGQMTGAPHVLGAQIAARQINEAGGIDGRQIELLVRDTHFSATDIVTDLRELAGLGVNLIMGEAYSSPDLAAFPIAPSLDIVFVVPTATVMELNHDLYNRNCFRACQNGYMEFLGEAKCIADHHPKLTRWGGIVGDSAGYRTAWEYLSYGLKKFYALNGTQIEIVEPVVAKLGTSDFHNQAAQLVAQKVDGIVLAEPAGDALSFIKQANSFGLFNSAPAVAGMTLTADFGPALKRSMPRNLWFACSWIYEAYKQFSMAQRFYAMARADSKSVFIDPNVAQAHLAITTLTSGVRTAKSIKTDDVVRAIETMTYDTVYGPMQFRAEDHQLHFNPGFARVGPEENESGWKIYDFVKIDWKDAIEPPSPGKKFSL